MKNRRRDPRAAVREGDERRARGDHGRGAVPPGQKNRREADRDPAGRSAGDGEDDRRGQARQVRPLWVVSNQCMRGGVRWPPISCGRAPTQTFTPVLAL